jgi:hypothetical protein
MQAFDQSNEQPGGNTMFTKPTILVIASSAFSAAMAQEHPWGPSGMYTGSLSTGDAYAQVNCCIRKGDIVDRRDGVPASPRSANSMMPATTWAQTQT